MTVAVFSHRMYFSILLCMICTALVCCTREAHEENLNHRFVLSNTMMKRIALDTAHMQQLESVLNLTGRITADDSKLIDVYPFVGGTVTSVSVALGDYVHKGQTLAVIRSGEVAEYERQLIDARSDVYVTQKNLSVQKDMASSKLSSDRDVTAAQRELEKAEAELRRIEEIYRIYSINNRSEYVVKAPISGFIIDKNINADMTLRTDRSASIFTIAELTDVWVVADVYESDISKVAAGMPARIRTVAYPDSIITGTVEKVFSILDPNTKTMTVRIRIPNGGYKVKPGMAATVSLRYSAKGQALAVLSTSLIFDDGKSYVMVYIDNNNIRTQEVHCGESVDASTYIRSGLNEGDIVISKNQLFIYDALND